MLEILLLLPALAADTLAAITACTAKGISIPKSSRLMIALVGSAFLLLAMLGGSFVALILPEKFCKAISFTVILLLGISNYFRSLLQSLLKKLQRGRKEMEFHLLGLSFLLSICADETVADADGSSTLSPSEAAALATALSLDSLAAGLAGAFSLKAALLAGIASLPLQLLAIQLGILIGRTAAKRFPANLPELAGGLLLILLAFLRLI